MDRLYYRTIVSFGQTPSPVKVRTNKSVILSSIRVMSLFTLPLWFELLPVSARQPSNSTTRTMKYCSYSPPYSDKIRQSWDPNSAHPQVSPSPPSVDDSLQRQRDQDHKSPLSIDQYLFFLKQDVPLQLLHEQFQKQLAFLQSFSPSFLVFEFLLPLARNLRLLIDGVIVCRPHR